MLSPSRIPTRDETQEISESETPSPARRTKHHPSERVASGPAEPVLALRSVCFHAAVHSFAAPSLPARLCCEDVKGLLVAEAFQAESAWVAAGLSRAPSDPYVAAPKMRGGIVAAWEDLLAHSFDTFLL